MNQLLTSVLALSSFSLAISSRTTERLIYDAVCYNGEIELLLFRLMSLNTTVDYFIVAESDCTFSSKPKEYFFRDRDQYRSDIRAFLTRIIYVGIKQKCFPPSSLSSDSNDPWQMEKELRNAVLKGISDEVPPTALLMIADIDEIPSQHSLQYVRHSSPNIIPIGHALHFKISMFYYDLSLEVSELWYHPQIMNVQDARNGGAWSPQSLRDVGFELSRNVVKIIEGGHTIIDNQYSILDLGGWHLSYFGNDEERARKIQSFSHQEFNVPSIVNRLKESRKHHLDPLRRKWQHLKSAKECEIKTLPVVVLLYPNLFGHFAPHCPVSRPACWNHINNNWKDGIITFSSSRNYIHGGEGGGLTNQIVGIKNGLLIANEVKIPIQLPFGYSRLSWNDQHNVWKYKYVDFDTLFSSEDLLKDSELSSKICLLTRKEVETFALNGNSGKRGTQKINVLNHVHTAGWRYLNVSFLGKIIRSEIKKVNKDVKKVQELWLGSTSDLIWALDTKTTNLSAYVLNNIRFAPIIEDIAHDIISTFRELNVTYFATHLRLDEYDSTAFVGGENVHEKNKEKNVGLQLVPLIQEYVRRCDTITTTAISPLVYVASGNSGTSLLDQLPWPSTRKEMLFPQSIKKLNKFPEMLGAVDFLVLEQSEYFVGFSQSTFSALLKVRRFLKGKLSTFYNKREPPWQIVLSLDPMENHFKLFRNKRKNETACRSIGQRADCLFTNV
jgi:hypothetical protein